MPQPKWTIAAAHVVNYTICIQEATMETILELPPEIAAAGTRSLRERQAATIAALDSFMEQDENEHRETLRVLRHTLDEDRPGQRRVFGAGNDSK